MRLKGKMRCYEEILAPIEQSRRNAVVLHREKMLPVILVVPRRPERQAPLAESGDEASFSIENLVARLSVSHQRRKKGVFFTVGAAKPQEPVVWETSIDVKGLPEEILQIPNIECRMRHLSSLRRPEALKQLIVGVADEAVM
jgi:hypothetical protein